MFIFHDQVEPSGHLARTGDIVVITSDDFGNHCRDVALVITPQVNHRDAVEVMHLPCIDPDTLEYYG